MRGKMSVMMLALVMVLGTMFPAGTDVLTQQSQNKLSGHGNESGNMTYGDAILNVTIYVDDPGFDSNWSCDGGVGVFDLDLNNNMNNMTDPSPWLISGFNITGTGNFYSAIMPAGDYHLGAGLDCIDDDGNDIGYHALLMDGNSTNNSLETFTLVNNTQLSVDFYLQKDDMGGQGPMYHCGNGDDIEFHLVNDGTEDCTDGSDEPQYDANGTMVNWFDCHDGSTVGMDLVNDGNWDCANGEDEGEYGGGPGGERMFDCADGTMSIYFYEVNDGHSDCSDGSDEPQYDASGNETSYYMCDGGNNTIPLSGVNDGTEDCEYGDDESGGSPGERTFFCANGAEIPFDWVNDGMDNCTDGSDEPQYDAAGNETSYYMCDGGNHTIPLSWVNDGWPDCEYGDDESDNGGEPSTYEWIAFDHSYDYVNYDNSSALPFFHGPALAGGLEEGMFYYINTTIQSDDGFFGSLSSDMFTGDNTSEFSLFVGQLYDLTDGCYYAEMDLISEDGNYVGYDGLEFSIGDVDCGRIDERMFDCADGTMSIYFYEVNDGFSDCTDGSDEPQYDASGNETSYYMCDGGNNTIPLSWVNDGVISCEYGDDEEYGSPGERTFVCGNGDEIPFDWVNDGVEDCDDGSDEPQYDGNGTLINWFDCYGGSTIGMDQVNDGNEDCPDGDDEMGDNGGDDGEDCVSFSVFAKMIGSSDDAQFEFTLECELGEEQSLEFRGYMDMFGNNDGVVSDDEVAAFIVMMSDSDGPDEPDDEEEVFWYADGTMLTMTEQPQSLSNGIGPGNMTMVMTELSGPISMLEGSDSIIVESNIEDEESDCVAIAIHDSENWDVIAASVSNGGWDITDMGDHFAASGCTSPGDITFEFFYLGFNETGNGTGNGTGEGNETVDQPPACMVSWTHSNDTAWAAGTEIIVDASGDHTLDMSPGNYFLGIFCIDDEGDEITISLSTADGSLSATQTGSADVSGWVDLTIPEGLTATIPIDYQWDSGDHSGAGTITITFTSDAGGDNSTIDDIETDSGGFLPGFTSILTISAMMGAVMFLSRREEK